MKDTFSNQLNINVLSLNGQLNPLVTNISINIKSLKG